MSGLYGSRELAKACGVVQGTVLHWIRDGKITPLPSKGAYMIPEDEVIRFLLDTHVGKYKTSGLDVFKAVKNLGLESKIELGETERLCSKPYPERHKARKPSLIEMTFQDDSHVVNDRQEYMNKIAQLKYKYRDKKD